MWWNSIKTAWSQVRQVTRLLAFFIDYTRGFQNRNSPGGLLTASWEPTLVIALVVKRRHRKA